VATSSFATYSHHLHWLNPISFLREMDHFALPMVSFAWQHSSSGNALAR
jgi:hypothetical protein